MQRYFIQLAYNGTNYCGWQVQLNAHTVQAEIEHALKAFLQENVNILGCGRTDTGVHAKQFYAHFDSNNILIDKEIFLEKINKILPHDIAIQDLCKINNKLHARFSATSRTYKYYIARVKDPFIIDSSYYLYGPLDIELMNRASQILLTYNDFSAFSKSNTQVNNNLCTITEAHWIEKDHILVFTITANRFLRNMVRAIVGTLLNVGKGKIDLEDFKAIIEKGQRSNAGKSAPAQGLFLHEVKYPEGSFSE